jgi:hypothetical protein
LDIHQREQEIVVSRKRKWNPHAHILPEVKQHVVANSPAVLLILKKARVKPQ